MHDVSINYVELNKACSLLIAYWTINTAPYYLNEIEEETQKKIDEIEAEI
jgi:hypothetical protein